MKNIRIFFPENVQFLEVKFSIYLNRRVFVMASLIHLQNFYMLQTVLMNCKNFDETLWM